jgi:voltage-gated potassium channel Kch
LPDAAVAGAAAASVVLLVAVLQDAFEVMLLPRRVQRRWRFMRFFFAATWSGWTRLARLIRADARRERFLGVYGALSMILLFAVWAGGLISGFGVLEWSLQANPPASPLVEQVYMSGVTFFTLGYGDVVPRSTAARAVAVFEAGTGIGFIAIVIGYLPVLYQLFARREAHVIQLDARAGTPPTAAEMLCRHAAGGGLGKLDELLREWEVWGSELLESHLSYPMLVYYRSQHDNQSWLAALAAVMDACALILVGAGGLPPLQARMTFAMARQVVVEVARSFAVAPSRYDGGDRLPPAAYRRMEAAFAEAGLDWPGGAETRETLAALRATYEPLLDGLSKALLLPLPGWVPADGAVDHWEHGHRGLIAKRLIEELTERPNAAAPAPDGRQRVGWQRLRRRLGRDA